MPSNSSTKILRLWQVLLLVALLAFWYAATSPTLLPPIYFDDPNKAAFFFGEPVKVFERDIGCNVEEANPGWSDPIGAFFAIMMAESDLKGMREMARKIPMSGHLVDALEIPWTAEEFTNANMTRLYRLDEMDADHVAAWSKGGDSDLKNCQMLCVTHNRAKGNR